MTLEEWSAAAVEPSAGSALPAPDEWSAVELPGTPARFAGSEAVAYRTQFPDPREGDQTRAVVTLRGLYARGRVWLNGDLLGSHGTYFEPARFVVDPEPTNDLVVEAARCFEPTAQTA
jgi:beta-mannosidase